MGFLLQFSSSMAFGEEPLLVRVLSVNQASGKISGQVLEGLREGIQEEKTTEIIVQMSLQFFTERAPSRGRGADLG